MKKHAATILLLLCCAAFAGAEVPETTRKFFESTALYAALTDASKPVPVGYFFPEGADLDTELSSPGYKEKEAWIYESLPDAGQASLLNMHFAALTTPHAWRRRYRPEPLPRRNEKQLRRIVSSGMPLLCDLSIDPQSHASLVPMEGVNPPKSFWPTPFEPSLPFTLSSADSRSFYLTNWVTDAESFRTTFQKQPDAFRLFTALRFWDSATSMRASVNRYMRDRYKTVAEFNERANPKTRITSFSTVTRFREDDSSAMIHVEHARFMEYCTEKMMAQAAELLAPVPVFFQTATFESKGVDFFQAFRHSPLLSAPQKTATPILTALYFRALSKGRPVLSPEVVPSANLELMRSRFLAELARGYSGITLAPARRNPRSFIKYTRNPKTRRSTRDELRTAEAMLEKAKEAPSNWLNPCVIVPETLLENFAQTKAALEEASRIFRPVAMHEPKPAAPLALLYSRASARLNLYKKPQVGSENDFVKFCHFSFIPFDLVLEEQLETLSPEVKVLLVPECVAASVAPTKCALTNWVSKGGVLLVNDRSLSLNEWGNPPKKQKIDFKAFPKAKTIKNAALAELVKGDGYSVHALGEGLIVFFPSIKEAKDLSAILAPLLTALDQKPILECRFAESGAPVMGLEYAIAPHPDKPGTSVALLFNRLSSRVEFDVSRPNSSSKQRLSLDSQCAAMVEL